LGGGVLAATFRGCNKKLSYRKQIARELRTQYVDGMYSKSATFKCRLENTQGQ